MKYKLVPKLRFAEFRDAGEWVEKQISLLSKNVTAGGTPSTSEKKYWGGKIRWMNSGELNYKKVYEVQGRITEEGLKNSSTKIIPPQSVLIGLAGQGKTRGTVAMNMIELCINQSIAAIFPNEERFSSDFLYHNLDNRYDELRGLSAGGEGRGGLNLQIIKSLKVPLPRLKEQQKIADCLSSLDDLITAQSQKLDALKTHKKGLMQQLFPAEGETVPRLRFAEFRGDGEWDTKNIADFAKVTTGNKDTQNKVDNGIYPFFVRSQTVERIDSFSYDGEAILTSGDGVGVGKNFHYINGKFDFHQRVYCIYGFDKNVSSKFLYLYFSEHFYKRVMQLSAKNSVDSVRMAMITEMPILLPKNILEQQKIADCLSSLDDLIAAQSQKLDALKAHKKGLMQQLFPNPNEIEE